MSVTLETAEGLTTTTKLLVTLRLLLTDDTNEHHVYNIPQCIYNPTIPLNIIVVPALVILFGNNADVHSTLAEDGTTVKYGTTKLLFFGITAITITILFMALLRCL